MKFSRWFYISILHRTLLYLIYSFSIIMSLRKAKLLLEQKKLQEKLAEDKKME